MPEQPSWTPYEYATIRVMPRVDRGEFINVGVVLFARSRRFLGARVELSPCREQALRCIAPDLDLDAVRKRLANIPVVCAGGKEAGPIGQLSQAERFHWIVAPTSTIVQPSPVHAGITCDPAKELDELFRDMVGEE